MKIAVLEGDQIFSNCLGFSITKGLKKAAGATAGAVKKTAKVTTKYAVRKPAQAIIGKKGYSKATKIENKYNPVKIATRNILKLTDVMKRGAISAIRKAAAPAVKSFIGKNPNLSDSGINAAANTLAAPVTATAVSLAAASTGGTAALLTPFIQSAVKNELVAMIKSMMPKKIVKSVMPKGMINLKPLPKAKPIASVMPKNFMTIKPKVETKAASQPPPVEMPKIKIEWPEPMKKTPGIIPDQEKAETKKEMNWILPAAAAGAALLILGSKR